jgi:lactoylglutathione lyase
MTVATVTSVNVKQAVPFFGVTNMESSLRFYVDGLGFKMKSYWIPDRPEDHPDGRIRWCWLQLGDAAIMLQEFGPQNRPNETLGTGASVTFMCEDALALYREFRSRGIQTRNRPSVGNRLWVGPGHRSRRLPTGVLEPHRRAGRNRARRVGVVRPDN